MNDNHNSHRKADDMELTAQKVNEIILDCLFKTDEIADGKPPADAVVVEGIRRDFGFHPVRLESHAEEIADLLAELPPEFAQGWSFLNMCMDRHGRQWGEHRDMEGLVALGLATGRAALPAPRDMWPMLPGGMPYVTVLPAPSAEPAPKGTNP